MLKEETVGQRRDHIRPYVDCGREFGLYTLYDGMSPEGFMQRSDTVLLHS